MAMHLEAPAFSTDAESPLLTPFMAGNLVPPAFYTGVKGFTTAKALTSARAAEDLAAAALALFVQRHIVRSAHSTRATTIYSTASGNPSYTPTGDDLVDMTEFSALLHKAKAAIDTTPDARGSDTDSHA